MTAAVATRGFLADRERFLERAAKATGLDDFGTDDFSEGLERFLDALDRDTRLSSEGQAATGGQVEAFLASRLHSEQGWKERPDALARPIRAPLIITGIVRSGTTALHKLMSMDPQFQGLEHWIARGPRVRPPRERWNDIAAYRDAVAMMDAMLAQAPEMQADHLMSADEVEESIFLLPQTFCDNMFPSMWNIPTYDAWYRGQDKTPSYRRLAGNLQLIGADAGERRWLLKNPTDLLAMEAVLNVFPDAMIVQTHRDPLQAVPSVCNLMYAARRIFEGPQSDPTAVGRRETAFWAQALAKADAARARLQRPAFDLEFDAFVGDPLGAVRAIYAHFGLELAPPVEAAMQRWLDAHPRTAHPTKRFQPADLGIDPAAIRAAYADYRRAHGYGLEGLP